jgi:hypothetical protein
MLEYEGDVAADFMQPFSIGLQDVFGHPHTHLLKENGDQIIVSNETRQVTVCAPLLFSQFPMAAINMPFGVYRMWSV